MAGEKVLVIDNKKDTVQFIKERVLRPHGYYCMIANNGRDGFRLALEMTDRGSNQHTSKTGPAPSSATISSPDAYHQEPSSQSVTWPSYCK